MQFDIGTVRAIVIVVGSRPPDVAWHAKAFDGYSYEEVFYNLREVFDRRLASGKFSRSGKLALVYGLTMGGREFFELAKSDSVWEKTISQIWNEGMPMTIESAWAILGRSRGLDQNPVQS
jgi:hypothetical protein